MASVKAKHRFKDFKLKPNNYLIWRTQILQLMQVMKVTKLINEGNQDKKCISHCRWLCKSTDDDLNCYTQPPARLL